jgi:hypothetical protein
MIQSRLLLLISLPPFLLKPMLFLPISSDARYFLFGPICNTGHFRSVCATASKQVMLRQSGCRKIEDAFDNILIRTLIIRKKERRGR